jgi:hypothetical protein
MDKRIYVSFLLALLAVTVGAAVVLVTTGEISWDNEPQLNAERTPVAASAAEEQPLPQPVEEPEPYRLYLVLDDAGHSLNDLRRFIRFPGQFTLAVLPRVRYSAESARMAVAAGHTVILHQPMEPLGDSDPGPGAILTTDSEYAVRRTIARNIESMSWISGINNHMGSRATQNRYTMEIVADELARREMFFLDSRTTAASVAIDVGNAAGIRVVERDVFLDNVRERSEIDAQIDLALQIARGRGWSVMIGHVTVPILADVLMDRYEEIIAAGYRFYPIEDLVQLLSDEDPRD